MIKRIDIQGATGIPMRAVFVPANEQRPNHPNAKPVAEDIIEFYDGRYPHTLDGQFITGYSVSMLDSDHYIRDHGYTACFDLMGYISDWKITGRTLGMVMDWAAYHIKQ